MRERLKAEPYDLHLELPRHSLVVWTGGNVSARDPNDGLVAIKPSGVRYDELRPEQMVVLDLGGNIEEGDLAPSSIPTATCTFIATVPMSAAWCIRIRATPPPAPPSSDRFRLC